MKAIIILLASSNVAWALNAPTNLTAQASSPTQIKLTWVDNSGGEERGFQIFQSRDGTNFINVKSVGRNVQKYTVGALINGTTYYYKVNAYDKKGNASGFSNTAAATTMNPGVSPSPTATASPTATPIPPTATPTPAPTATPTASPSATASPSPSLSPTPTPIPPTPTPSSTPSPIVTPSPSSSPIPTATPSTTRTVTVEIVNPTAGDTYLIYYGRAPDSYGPPVAILAGAISVDVPGLTVGNRYYFANTVKNDNGVSAMSSPVPYVVTTATTQQLSIP